MQPPAFKIIARQISVPNSHVFYFGPVIASAKYLMIVPERIRTAESMGMAAAGGAIGALIGALANHPSHPLRPWERTLPPSVTGHAEWPLQDITGAIVFAKEDVKDLSYPWYGTLKFRVRGVNVNVQIFFLRRSSVLRHLRSLGWAIK